MEEQRSPAIRVSIALLLLFQLCALLIRSFVQLKMVAAGHDPVFARHFSALAGFAVLGILIWPVISDAGPILRPLFRRPASWLRMMFASAGLGFVIWLGQMLALLACSTSEWFGQGPYNYPSRPEYYFACRNPAVLFLAIPVMAVLTPIIEETFNRGLILHSFLPTGRMVAIAVSATTFTLFHRPEAMPFAFLFGLIAAIQMLHYRTLWAVFFTHGSANFLTEVSRNCIDGFWLPGKITWTIESPMPQLLMTLIACSVLAWWLAARCEAGAGPVKDRPDSG